MLTEQKCLCDFSVGVFILTQYKLFSNLVMFIHNNYSLHGNIFDKQYLETVTFVLNSQRKVAVHFLCRYTLSVQSKALLSLTVNLTWFGVGFWWCQNCGLTVLLRICWREISTLRPAVQGSPCSCFINFCFFHHLCCFFRPLPHWAPRHWNE